MDKLKILVAFGTRPEAIKLAPVIAELRSRPNDFDVKVCLTGQHRQMVDQVISLFDIKVDYDLNLMTLNQSLESIMSRMLISFSGVLEQERPIWVLVQGDTTTAMAGSLSAFYRGIKVGHVEAGLRTYDLQRPFPEEFNRRLIDIIAEAYFAPTEIARANLLREGILNEKIIVTGNTGIDALLHVSQRDQDWSSGPLSSVPRNRRIVLITAHRRESFGSPFRSLCRALRALSERFTDTEFVYPVHLNPNVQSVVREQLGGRPNLHLLAPLDYASMVTILHCCFLVLTDSGGIQEEAPSFGCPILVLRDTTERPEAVSAGFAKLVGTGEDRIIAEATVLLQKTRESTRVRGANPFGDGIASRRIADHLVKLSVPAYRKQTMLKAV
jgi:UDP-N-acetylglucosamine 2-epimerase (non-hydrolysing)